VAYKDQEKVIKARVEIGRRIESLRIVRNVKQADLSSAADVAPKTYRRITKVTGDAGLDGFLAIANELGVLDAVVAAFPEEQISPMQVLKNHGRPRKRVKTANPAKDNDDEVTEW
jgi:transcriptional regulator with XRE-family HTH domain